MNNIHVPVVGTVSGLTMANDVNAGFDSLQENIGGVLTKSVAGSADVTLSSAEANKGVMVLTGAIGANINCIVPASAMAWTVTNSTSGAFSVTVKTPSGSGVSVPQGQSMSLYCDATNVYPGSQPYDANTVKKNVAQVFTATQTPSKDTAAVSTTSSVAFDGSVQVRETTFTNAITATFAAPTGIVEGSLYIFKLKAGDTAARAYAWNAAYKFPGAVAPLTSGTLTSGAKDIITFIGGPSNTLEYQGHQADVR